MQYAQTEMEHTPVHATMVMKEMALIALTSTNVMVRIAAIWMQIAQTEMEPTTAHAMMVMKAMASIVQVGSFKISYRQFN